MDFLQLPRFASEKLTIWFAQAESVFTLNAIETDSDKYDYIVAHIPMEFSSMVEDILLNPPPNSKYDHIKYEFIKRMSIYRLKKEEMGPDSPSVYLQRLRNMADQRVPLEVILNTWLNNLPKPVREILSFDTTGNMETLGAVADKVMALLPANAQSNRFPISDQFKYVVSRIDALSKQVQQVLSMLGGEIANQNERNNVRVAPAPTSSAPPNRSNSHGTVCWYHTVYGDRAVSCIPPCGFVKPIEITYQYYSY